MRYQWFAVFVVALTAGPALAQIDKYDANTGKYVTADPYVRDAPPPYPSPYRLNPRVSGGVQTSGVVRVPATSSQAPAAGRPAMGSHATAVAGTSVTQQSQQMVPMDGMPMYGASSNPVDPFAKPDWWPQ